MSYPYVPSAVDLGPARGPRLAMCWHMAEGGGTVGYLSRPNPNNVSVHFVVEYGGRIVQMLPLDHMHTSIRASDIRMTDDPAYTWAGERVTYGHSAAKAVLGDWATTLRTLGPNHATIAVEVEGFAKDGPNTAQRTAIGTLAADMVRQFPGLRHLGHRDFADYKLCPGFKFPWDAVGGHATRGATDMLVQVTVTPFAGGARGWGVPAGTTLSAYDPARPGGPVATTTFKTAYRALCDADVFVAYPGTANPPVPKGGPFIRVTSGGFAGLLVVKAQVAVDAPPPPPAPDCTAAVEAATKPLEARIAAAKVALG